MDYGEAIEALERANEKFEFPVKWDIDLRSEHERYLTEKHAKKPVIVMNYPKAIKAFYVQVNDDDRTVAAMDVLAPGIGEIIAYVAALSTVRDAIPFPRTSGNARYWRILPRRSRLLHERPRQGPSRSGP
jgi:aspartyl/asparaginyl-tRNA synthetase